MGKQLISSPWTAHTSTNMKFTPILLACLVAGSVATNPGHPKLVKKQKIKAAKSEFKAAIKGNGGKGKGFDPKISVDPVHPDTKYCDVCEVKTEPHCHVTKAKECYKEESQRCSFVTDKKCKKHAMPHCELIWEKRCSKVPTCAKTYVRECKNDFKTVCVWEHEKVCSTHTVRECHAEPKQPEYHEVEPVEPVHPVYKRSLSKDFNLEFGFEVEK